MSPLWDITDESEIFYRGRCEVSCLENSVSSEQDARTTGLMTHHAFLIVVTDKLLPERPYRYEPRLKKRRPKPYGWMQQPRDVLKRKLVA